VCFLSIARSGRGFDIRARLTYSLGMFAGRVRIDFRGWEGAPQGWHAGFLQSLARILPAVIAFSLWTGAPHCKPNILLLVLDTVRPDHLSCYGYNRNTSPTVDSLAAEGLLFEYAYTATPASQFAHEALLTGVIPGYSEEFIYRPDQTLAGIMSKTGYVSVGVTANPLLDPDLYSGFAGFDSYTLCAAGLKRPDKRKQEERLAYWEHLRCDSVNARVEERLEELLSQGTFGQGRKLFLFVNYMDAHEPYEAPGEYKEMFTRGYDSSISGDILDQATSIDGFIVRTLPTLSPDDVERLRALYDGEIAYEDGGLRRLLCILDRLGFGEDLAVIVVSDHGEYLGEHGMFCHANGLDEEVLHVACIVHYPEGTGPPRRVSLPVSLADVPATILDLAELEAPSYMDGISLIREIPQEHHVFSIDFGSVRRARILGPSLRYKKVSVRWDKWKFIEKVSKDELYELEGDTFVQRPFRGKLAVLAVKLKKRIKAFIASQEEKEIRRMKRVPSEDRLERLRELGYIE